MKNYKLHTSEGVKDYLGNELLVKEEIEKRIKDLFISYGYELVKTPTFEYIDVYSNKNALQQPSLYNLINRQGEVLALRNDMTSSIARIVASNNINSVKKYCYISDTFRYPRAYQGKAHEFTQAGIEIVGVASIKAEVECIKLAYLSLKKVGLDKFMIHVGSSEFIEALFTDFNIDKTKRETLFSIIEKKDFVLLKNTMIKYNVNKEYIDLVLMLMSRAGKLNFLDMLINKLEGFKSREILIKMHELYNELMLAGLQNWIVFDFSIYSYAKYYTGVVFQIFALDVGSSLVNGGRCDDLLYSFESNNYMIGFGLNVDSLLEYVINHELIKIKKQRYLSFINNSDEDYVNECNEKLRKQGIIVSNSMEDSLEKSISYALSEGFNLVLYYKDNSVEKIKVGDN